MVGTHRAGLRWVAVVVAGLAMTGAAVAASGNFVLIRRDHPVQLVEVAQISTSRVVYREGGSVWQSVPRDECVAILNRSVVITPQRPGWLRLADGQVFPGEALSGARASDDVLAWNQSTWLGRMEVPLERIDSVVFTSAGSVPAAGDTDVLMLANGDRLEGIVSALGDPVSVDVFNGGVEGVQSVQLPLDRVSSVRMVTPPRRPRGQRLWLGDGTVVDVEEVLLGDDGFYRVEGVLVVADEPDERMDVGFVAAVLFNPEALRPFAELVPSRVEGPPTRYVVPYPKVIDETAPLGLRRVEFRGPVTVRYQLPESATYLAALAQLPVNDRLWGDCELVIRDDDRVVFTTRLNADEPAATIGVPLRGSILTVEVTEGSAGPIQDHVVLSRALILKASGRVFP